MFARVDLAEPPNAQRWCNTVMARPGGLPAIERVTALSRQA
jgi:hypothetical protein